MQRRVLAGLTLVATGLVLVMGGCETSAAREQLAEIRADPTPELTNLSQRPDDIDNQLTVTFDTNLRSFNRDLGKALLLDKPSRLSPSPIR